MTIENNVNQEDNINEEDFFNEFSDKAQVKDRPNEIIDNPEVNVEGQNTPVNEEDLTEEEIAEKKLAEETAKKEEEEKLAKETADKLAQEEANKPLKVEDIKKQLLDEMKVEKEKEENIRKEVLKKEQEEKVAKETADKLAKEIEDAKNWNPDSVYTKEEKEELESLEKEYPEVKKLHVLAEKRQKAVMDRQVAEVRKEIEAQILNYHQFISAQINPVIQTQQLSQAELEKKEVFNAHPDFNDVMPKVEDWIKSKQDGKLKDSLVDTFTNGSYKDVIELFNMYKEFNGISTSNAELQAKNEEKAKLEADKKAKEIADKELADKKKKEKAQALGAVSSSNTQIDNNSSEKDEEDWFNSYSTKVKK